MNKYDWSNVPSYIMWIATDDDTVSNGFIDKPSVAKHGMWAVDNNYEAISLDLPLYYDNWQDSLEERPND